MYNGIGLQTARGSGTSGYVQKNLSYNVKKLQTKEEFLKDLQQKRNANLPMGRKANSQIVEHERKREILIQKMRLKKKLEEDGVPQNEIEEKLKKLEEALKIKLEKGEMQTRNKDSHVMTELKQREFSKLSIAFGLRENEKPGSAFDFEGQRQQRLKRMQQRRLKHNFECPHEQCRKRYENQQLLDRHLKYKHPSELKIEEGRSAKQQKASK